MNNLLNRVKAYADEHTHELKIAGIAFGGIALVILFIALYIYNVESKQIKLDYQPVSACALLTNAEAKELLGDNIIDTNTNQATVSGDRATSKCSYTDKNPNNMAVIGVAVKSAINANGVEENKHDFATNKEANEVESVTSIGDDAYYIPANGQLNILDGRAWILITYGTGDTTSGYTLDNAVKVANKVIEPAK